MKAEGEGAYIWEEKGLCRHCEHWGDSWLERRLGLAGRLCWKAAEAGIHELKWLQSKPVRVFRAQRTVETRRPLLRKQKKDEQRHCDMQLTSFLSRPPSWPIVVVFICSLMSHPLGHGTLSGGVAALTRPKGPTP